MTKVAVWGTGNVGRAAIRSVAAHRGLELAAVIVSNPDKVGVDAGKLALIEDLGVAATDDREVAKMVDVLVYTVNADFRPDESLAEVDEVLRAGVNVVSTSFYPLLHPPTSGEVGERIAAACTEGDSSIFVSGIDPGWAIDLLPLLAAGVCADITEIRCQELFNYALYDQPDAVRDLCGFGHPMDYDAPMLLDFSLRMVWAPMVSIIADGLGVSLDEVRTKVEKRPLERTVTVDGMGDFEKGNLGAFRFEVQGIVGGEPLIVVEHITRIDDECAPDWPHAPVGQGVHQVQITGRPNLTLTVHGEEQGEPGAAGGGNATAANRIVNAIPAVVAAPAGLIHPLDVAPAGGAQLRTTGTPEPAS